VRPPGWTTWNAETGGDEAMEFSQRAAVRIRHWMEHNERHLQEYEEFAAQLEAARASRSAAHIREMAALTREIDSCLQKALAAVEDAGI
jgi:hypothetical protein